MSTTIILGVDPGTASTGYATLIGNLYKNTIMISSNPAYFGVLKTSKWSKDREEINIRSRIDIMGRLVEDCVRNIRPTHLVIEDFVEQGVSTGKVYKDMSYLIEHLRLLGQSIGLDTTIYPNRHWKKHTIKAQTANKGQVNHYIRHTFPNSALMLENAPDHVWDSVGIGYCKWLELRAKFLKAHVY